jgi:putative iron-dependent peroxidase
MLHNMFVGSPPGNTDRILDFSTAVSGSLFFVPTLHMLDDPPPAAGAESAGAESAGVDTEESLGIGSLKESAA